MSPPLLLLSVHLLSITAAPVADSTTLPPQLDLGAVLDSVRIETGTPAIAAAVIVHGRIVALGISGVRELGKAAKAGLDDPFHVGSCTKSMTATMIGSLVDEGRLHWTTTLLQVFPEWRDSMRAEYRGVTLLDLLTHRGHVPPYEEVADQALKQLLALPGTPTAARLAFARRLLNEPPATDTSAAYTYSNAGYTLAAAMAERVTGSSWESLMRTRLFAPLGMTQASFGWPATKTHPLRPRGHRCMVHGDTIQCAAVPLDDWYRLGPFLAPGGDVSCSIVDFARFAAFHLAGTVIGGGHPPVRPATLDSLHRDPAGARPGYACGWQVIEGRPGETVLLHDGTAGTFYARIVLFPERDRAVVVVTNSGEPTGSDACRRATTAAYRAAAPH